MQYKKLRIDKMILRTFTTGRFIVLEIKTDKLRKLRQCDFGTSKHTNGTNKRAQK